MAQTDVLVHINMNGNEIQNVLAQKLATAPSTNVTAGRFYFNTTDNTLYVYDGTTWLNALAQGTTYSEGSGIDITNNTISIELATGANAGNVTLSTTNGLSASAPSASTSTAGLIEIATDTEASTGTDTSRAVTPKQLATKVTANTAISGATKCKITYDAKGLVTAGADLQASDIPNLTLSKITDVTASASELNIMDGVTVTTSDINSVTSKIGLTNLSIDSASTNYLGYDNTTGKFSAKVDTIVGTVPTNLVTSGAVQTAINNAVAGGIIYKGVWTVTSSTSDYSGIPFPVKAGWEYDVSGSAQITLDGVTVDWNSGDYIRFKNDVASVAALTNSDFNKIDNTESSDTVKLNATQTLTNKTIDADNNTISDLTTSNFKSGVVATSIGIGSDTELATTSSVKNYVDNSTLKSYVALNPALTASSGVCTWSITDTNIQYGQIQVFNASSGEEVICSKALGSSGTATVKFNSTSNISAGTYRVEIIGAKATSND